MWIPLVEGEVYIYMDFVNFENLLLQEHLAKVDTLNSSSWKIYPTTFSINLFNPVKVG